MFEPNVYVERRKRLMAQLGSGLVLLPGNDESPMNYPANTYPFRQDSSFLYFFGLAQPGWVGVLDVDAGKEILFGDDISLEDVIWMGDLPTVKERAALVGVGTTRPPAKLESVLLKAKANRRKIHFLPPYRAETVRKLSGWLGLPLKAVKARASQALSLAVIAQRSVKSPAEVDEIERALDVTREMYLAAMAMVRPGLHEYDVMGRIEGIALGRGCRTAFPSIVTVNGQILHNHGYHNVLTEGRLLVDDSGAEAPSGYASDITRTIPVGGRFAPRQKEVYEVVLEAQETAIRAIKPGVKYRDVHLEAARAVAAGLKGLGLMTGDPAEAVRAGAHALFFPHGLGHMMGLDVHDMEDIGETLVGYTDRLKRSSQFGLAYLRLARELEPGFVLTVEPGVYFIPPLIDKWRKARKFADFIDYGKVEGYRDFGGIRIEDDVLVTADGRRVLGRPIPKTVAEVEGATGRGD
ncbi:MAG: aminopeptidase P family protein [Candidatus Aminicenantes bacterium]|nr:aminopeptidase P family protein [Candidatus Aminicenantes bacterium]